MNTIAENRAYWTALAIDAAIDAAVREEREAGMAAMLEMVKLRKAEERETCAKVADSLADEYDTAERVAYHADTADRAAYQKRAAETVAAAIRARSAAPQQEIKQ